uniref:Uncharacterized protein n=1 Tax=Globodera pallida TaxID=36090 RepID=A0A183BLD0_GLOPA
MSSKQKMLLLLKALTAILEDALVCLEGRASFLDDFLFSALPLEHASRLLLLYDRINNNCIWHVRKLRQKWKEFFGRRVNELIKRYHPRLPVEMRAIEKAHLEVNLAAQQEDIDESPNAFDKNANACKSIGESYED